MNNRFAHADAYRLVDELLEGMTRRNFLGAMGKGLAAMSVAGPVASAAAASKVPAASDGLLVSLPIGPGGSPYYLGSGFPLSGSGRVFSYTPDRKLAHIFKNKTEVDALRFTSKELDKVAAEVGTVMRPSDPAPVPNPIGGSKFNYVSNSVASTRQRELENEREQGRAELQREREQRRKDKEAQTQQKQKEQRKAQQSKGARSRFDYAGGSEDIGYSDYSEALELVRVLLNEEEDREGWIGVDLDGCLARHTKWKGSTHIGSPVPRMVKRVRRWVGHGKKVKIFTARADDEKSVNAIKKWLKDNELPDLEVTNVKDSHMTVCYDDRTVSVEKNTGKVREAQDIEQQLLSVSKKIKHCGDYGTLYYSADKHEVHWTAADSDSQENGYTDTNEIVQMLKLPGIRHVEIGDEWSPDEADGWKRLN